MTHIRPTSSPAETSGSELTAAQSETISALLRETMSDVLGEFTGTIKAMVEQSSEAASPIPPLLTIGEVARILQLSIRSVETLIAEGKIVPLRVRPGARRFSIASIESFLRACVGKPRRRRNRP